MAVAMAEPLETRGRCSSDGFSTAAANGPNCTYVGSHSWSGELMIGSCARNVRSALERHSRAWVGALLDHLAAGGGGGGGVLIFEDEQRSGDPDGTRKSLRSWAAQDARVRLLLAAPLLYPRWSRTQRLALCRNMLASEARKALSERGALIALDLDCRGPEPRHIAAVLASMGRWDVLTANTRPPGYYYDRWALRSSVLGVDYDCWFNQTQRRLRGSCPDYAITIDPAAQAFGVDSAFNGLGIYRASSLRAAAGCRYRGTKNSYLCEHVPFHLCLRSHQLAIGVLPSLAVECGTTQISARRRYVRYLANGSVDVELPSRSPTAAAFPLAHHHHQQQRGTARARTKPHKSPLPAASESLHGTRHGDWHGHGVLDDDLRRRRQPHGPRFLPMGTVVYGAAGAGSGLNQ